MPEADADVVSATRATYDAIANDYEARNASGTEPRDWMDELMVGLRPGDRLVDLGCGPGLDAAGLRTNGVTAFGLDLSTSMLHLAERHGVPVVQGDLRTLPFRDQSLDAVWSCAALLHVPRAETVATLAEWRRVTRVGGVLCLSTSNGDDEGWEVVPYAPPPEGEPRRRRWFVHRTRPELVTAITSAGWRVEHIGARESNRRWHLIRARA